MFCVHCGTDLPDGSAFCSSCGKAPFVAGGTGDSKTRLDAGVRLMDRYEVVCELGRGGMGVVYQAVDRVRDREVALKMLPPELRTDDRAIANLINEVNIVLDNLNHDNICRVYEFQQCPEAQFVVMEYIEGRSLEQLLVQQLKKGKNGFPLEQVVQWLEPICAAPFAHAGDIAYCQLHEDVEPVAGLPEAVNTAMESATAKEKEERPGRASQFLAMFTDEATGVALGEDGKEPSFDKPEERPIHEDGGESRSADEADSPRGTDDSPQPTPLAVRFGPWCIPIGLAAFVAIWPTAKLASYMMGLDCPLEIGTMLWVVVPPLLSVVFWARSLRYAQIAVLGGGASAFIMAALFEGPFKGWRSGNITSWDIYLPLGGGLLGLIWGALCYLAARKWTAN